MIRYDGGEFYKKYLLKVDFEGKDFYYVTISRMNQSWSISSTVWHMAQMHEHTKFVAKAIINRIAPNSNSAHGLKIHCTFYTIYYSVLQGFR